MPPDTSRNATKALAGAQGRRLLTDRQAAEYVGTSRSYLRSQVASGRIPRVELPAVEGEKRARMWRVDVIDLDKWIDSLKG